MRMQQGYGTPIKWVPTTRPLLNGCRWFNCHAEVCNPSSHMVSELQLTSPVRSLYVCCGKLSSPLATQGSVALLHGGEGDGAEGAW